MTPDAPPPEIRALTGIRGVAAIMVVLFHFHDAFVRLIPGWKVFAQTASRGPLGVDLFFMLSGFILCHVYHAGERPISLRSHRRFLWLRIARVYPNHFVSLIVMFGVVLIARAAGRTLPGSFPIAYLPFQLSMTHAWFHSPGIEWNYPSWSISSEWFGYVFLFPLGSWYLSRRPRPWIHFVLVLVLTQGWLLITRSNWSRDMFPLLRILCGFMAGVGIYGVYRSSPRVVGHIHRYSTEIALAFLIFVTALPVWFHRGSELILLVIPALLIALTAKDSAATRLLGSPGAHWLGRISYALYMSHAITEKILDLALPSERFVNATLAVRASVMLGYWAALFVGAIALYHGVEEPGREWLRRLRPGPRPA